MKLWLLRHGQAAARAASDAERELTEAGQLEVRQAARRLTGRPLTTILVSPYVRARQTAELVRDELGFDGAFLNASWLTPDSDPREALLHLDTYEADEILLVTHQPLVGTLGGLLIHGHRQQPLPMRTASLAELEGEMAAAGLMTLKTLSHPD
ncbi:phosphohistidine phosphatase SixA [Pseudomonas sp. NCCP-436]|uniref:phosphohistidine phosphatase SixA n=1 Tax=Pseudomonas sp. NCCP-436 TaxID=2842481 RepID=UPI001C7FB5F8|nr:phosphohistidine phosphatase SixA [Pseudomonas sp. NCCP-436]GIZ11921.1 phosphohistidine phosphatase SixA [Pseudomonas sp. NCCP-436]